MPRTSNNQPTMESPSIDKKYKANGVRLEVTGSYIHATKGEQEYSIKLELPRRTNWRLYLKEAAELALRKQDANISGVITHYVDDEEDCEIELPFIGKNVFDLNREEMFMAKCYYGLAGMKCNESKRPAQIMIYRQLCTLLSLPEQKGDDNIKTWPVITFKPLITPAGDTLVDQVEPIRFLDDDDRWIKKVVLD